MKLRVFVGSVAAAFALLATMAVGIAAADPSTPAAPNTPVSASTPATPTTPLNLSTLYTCQANAGGCTIGAAMAGSQGNSYAVGAIANGYGLVSWAGGNPPMNGTYYPNVLHGVVTNGALAGFCAFTEPWDWTNGWFGVGSAITPTTCNSAMIANTQSAAQFIANGGNATYAFLTLSNGCGSAPCWNGPCYEYLNEYPWSSSPVLNGEIAEVWPATTQAEVRYAALYSPSGGQVYSVYDVTSGSNRWVFIQNGSPAGCYINP
jgi:hypothetical protein